MQARRRRLVDYVVVVGYNHERERNRRKRGRNTLEPNYLRQGTILQRFPAKDWNDVPFIGEYETHSPQSLSLSPLRANK